jgi:DNA-binding PadR family transcriptional regulator
LPFLLPVELLSKVLFQRGQVRLPELASHLKLSISVITPLVTHLRNEKLCEVTRSGSSGTDADLTYHLTEAGMQRAIACLNRNSYAGPAPVTLAAYVAQMESQSVRHLHVTREDGASRLPRRGGQSAGAGPDGRGHELGPRDVHLRPGRQRQNLSGRAPVRPAAGAIAVPYAIMIDGEVVPFYDPVQHRPIDHAPPGEEAGELLRQLDPRWVRNLQRPTALTGGELTLEMLDLRFDPTPGCTRRLRI